MERVTRAYYESAVPERPESVLQGWADYQQEQEAERAEETCVVGMLLVRGRHACHSMEAMLRNPKRRVGNWLWLGGAAALMLGFYTQQPHFPVMVLVEGQDPRGFEVEEQEDALPELAAGAEWDGGDVVEEE